MLKGTLRKNKVSLFCKCDFVNMHHLQETEVYHKEEPTLQQNIVSSTSLGECAKFDNVIFCMFPCENKECSKKTQVVKGDTGRQLSR